MWNIIATFIIIYLVFRFLITMVFPAIARWYIKRYQKKFYKDNPWAADAEKRRKDPRQTQQPPPPSISTDQIGEYVEFEEVEEEKKEDKKHTQ